MTSRASKADFVALLSTESLVEMDKLASLAKNGVPHAVRGVTWKYLLSVSKPDKSEEISIQREKMRDYADRHKDNSELLRRVDVYGEIRRYIGRGEIIRDTARKRLFGNGDTRKKLQNILVAYLNYNTHIEYHSGMIHLLGPFLASLTDEADIFHCFQVLMKKIDDILSVGGINLYVAKFITAFRVLLPEVHDHFEGEELEYIEWAVPWLRFLLSRELPLESVARLWDMYFALESPSPQVLFDFHMYTCLAVLHTLQEHITDLEHGELLAFLKHLPKMDMDQIITKAHYMREDMDAKDIF